MSVAILTERVIPSDPSDARRVQDEIAANLTAYCPEQLLFGVKLALEEAIVNAIKHGNQYDRNKTVIIRWSADCQSFLVIIIDQGQESFDPEDVPDCTADENVERPCGRGLMLMRRYMTEVTFSFNHGTQVTMTKDFTKQR